MVRSVILCEERYSHVVFERGAGTFLTFLSGGPVELDCTVPLRTEEIASIKVNQSHALDLVRFLKANPSLLSERKLPSPIWPQDF